MLCTKGLKILNLLDFTKWIWLLDNLQKNLTWGFDMKVLEDDLTQINYQYLMLARECARNAPLVALWKFNLSTELLAQLRDLTLEEIGEMAKNGRALLSVLPPEPKHTFTPRVLSALMPVTAGNLVTPVLDK